jgi:hypothetical protein
MPERAQRAKHDTFWEVVALPLAEGYRQRGIPNARGPRAEQAAI